MENSKMVSAIGKISRIFEGNKIESLMGLFEVESALYLNIGKNVRGVSGNINRFSSHK